MTVYIVHIRNHSEFHGVYTDLAIAQQVYYTCTCNKNNPFEYWDITPIELTTDSFMESVLTNKDNK